MQWFLVIAGIVFFLACVVIAFALGLLQGMAVGMTTTLCRLAEDDESEGKPEEDERELLQRLMWEPPEEPGDEPPDVPPIPPV